MALTLAEAIARVPQWEGALEIKTAPLGGGITNRNFRVDVDGESFVLRIGGEKTELLGIDRHHERAANEAAAAIGLAPEVVYFIEPEGYLVTRFLGASPLPSPEMVMPDNIRRVALALRRFHAIPAIPGSFSPFQTVDAYAEIARRYGVAFPKNFDWLTARRQEIESALRRYPFTPRPCHNDLLNENFLDDGTIRILDWEYAGMGDPAFDLANFSVHHGFSDEQDRLLLEIYLTANPLSEGWGMEVRFARHKLLKLISDFREAMWGVVQVGISQLDFDFRAYAGKHFGRMAEMARDSRYGEWLRAFQA
jgi:thiamine kinase-like enzyme